MSLQHRRIVGFFIWSTLTLAACEQPSELEPAARLSDHLEDPTSPSYEMIALEHSSCSETEASGINDSDVVVGNCFTAAGGMNAVQWKNNAMSVLPAAGNPFTIARGINSQGQIVGGGVTPSFVGIAIVWEDGVLRELPNLPGARGVIAEAINDAGEIAGTVSMADFTAHAVRWKKDGTLEDLGTLGGRYSWARSINSHGQIVGESTLADETFQHIHAFLWDNGVMHDLGDIFAESWVTGVNDRGDVVGTFAPNGVGRPFLASKGEFRDLGTLPGGEVAVAQGINAQGQVVGWSDGAVGMRAVLWNDNAVHQVGQGVTDYSVATAINSRGNIVGRADGFASLWVRMRSHQER